MASLAVAIGQPTVGKKYLNTAASLLDKY